jgi:hypothetical protein
MPPSSSFVFACFVPGVKDAFLGSDSHQRPRNRYTAPPERSAIRICVACLPCGDPRPSRAGPRMAFVQPIHIGGNRRYCMNCTHFESLHPRPRLAAGKEVRVLCMGRQRRPAGADKHASLPSGSRRNTSVLSDARLGMGACVRGFFELFLPRRGPCPCLEQEHGLFSFACTHASRLRLAYVQRACVPAKIGEFMRQLLRVIEWRVCCSPCAHHLACKKSNNAEEA